MGLTPASGIVRIRMYRQGLGDCFLLSHFAGGKEFHALIDCGVAPGGAQATDRMRAAVRDIAVISGWKLDVVIVTHKHWGRVSGFLQACELFDTLTIGEVWLPWTENPTDASARSINVRRDSALDCLRRLAGQIDHVDPAWSQRLGNLFEFFDGETGSGANQALNYLVHHRSGPRTRYLRPGQALPDVFPDLTVYTLGPPRPESGCSALDGLRSSDYLSVAVGLPEEEESDSSTADDVGERFQAFERRFRKQWGTANQSEGLRRSYVDPRQDWRRIDTDWLSSAASLALALDAHTNDTSLVLAFELRPNGKVLLFPGDAQAASWSTWQNYRWPAPGNAAPALRAADLLKRTVLYKVSHHGSHGATPDEFGLAQMISPELVALVTADSQLAESRGWSMPFAHLLQRLHDATGGRVLQSDRSLPQRPAHVGDCEWRQFLSRVHVDPAGLFYDYTL